MDIFDSLQEWFIPIANIFLVILCALYLKRSGKGLLIVSLIFSVGVSFAYLIVNLEFVAQLFPDFYSLHETLNIVDIVFTILSQLLFITAWVNLSQPNMLTTSNHLGKNGALSLKEQVLKGLNGKPLVFNLLILLVIPLATTITFFVDSKLGPLLISFGFTLNYLLLSIFCFSFAKNHSSSWVGSAFLIISIGQALRAVIHYLTMQGIISDGIFQDTFLVIQMESQIYFSIQGIHLSLLAVGLGCFFLQGFEPQHSVSDQSEGNDSIDSKGNLPLYLCMLYTAASLLMFSVVAGEYSFKLLEITLIGGVISLIVAQVYFFIMLFRLWKFVIKTLSENGMTAATDSAAKAVGFLFIPLFSFYWMFIAFGKLPQEYNRLADFKGRARIAGGIGVFVAIASVLSIIPLVGLIFSGLGLILFGPLFLHQTLTAAEELSKNHRKLKVE